MFSGEYYHSIDAKGRLIIPAKLREELGDKFVITKGYDGNCLSILPMKAWEELENKLANPSFYAKINFVINGIKGHGSFR